MNDTLRILVVEDDTDLLMGTARLLEKAGYSVDKAADGEATFQAIQQRRPDMILLDRDLPDMDGLEVCRRIKQDPVCADMAVILISSTYTQSNEQADGLEGGADGYIARPIENRELLARVQAYARILSLTRELKSKVKELEAANAASSRSALATLNLLEDAVAARDQMNATNQQLQQEIEERKQAEIRMNHLNQVLRAIRDVNQLMTHETDRDALLRRSCEILVSTRGYRSAWVALRNSEGRLSAVAESGIGEDFSAVRERLEQGEWPECYRRALEHPDGIAPVHDTAINCRRCALSHTYRDTAALAGRLRHAGHDYGVMVVALPEGLADDADEQALFQELSGDVAYALYAMETIERRRREETRFRAYVESAPYGIFIADGSGRFQDVNPAAEQITGRSREELLTMSLADLRPPESRLEDQAFLQQLMDEGRVSEERPFVHKSGQLRHWNLSVVKLSEDCFLGYAQDITDRKKAEAERDNLQAQFLQAQKMESVGRLAGGVAHDFNNILQAMMGYSQMLLDRLPRQSEDHEFAATIYAGAEKAATLTRQLLAFARKQTISPQALDLNATVESMLKMLRRLIGENIELTWQPAGDLWTITMDPGQIDQILANLCVNARDAITDSGKVMIETRNVTFDEFYCADHAGFVPGEFVMLAVSDNGCGMDKQTQEKIFEPFFTTKDLGKGTGLGLATVYGIVKQNNGYINVYSEPGEGTTFKVYLPRHNAPAAPEPKVVKAESYHGHGETVMLVEDDAPVLRLGERILKSMDYDVHAFTSPAEALRFAKNKDGAIHLLITDVVLPGMNGRDLANAIRDVCPQIRVLFMSGYTANVIAHRGVLDKAVNFIHKPLSILEFQRTVFDLLAGSQPPAQEQPS